MGSVRKVEGLDDLVGKRYYVKTIASQGLHHPVVCSILSH